MSFVKGTLQYLMDSFKLVMKLMFTVGTRPVSDDEIKKRFRNEFLLSDLEKYPPHAHVISIYHHFIDKYNPEKFPKLEIDRRFVI